MTGQKYGLSPPRNLKKRTHSFSLIPVASLSPALGGIAPNPAAAWQSQRSQTRIHLLPDKIRQYLLELREKSETRVESVSKAECEQTSLPKNVVVM